MFLITDLHRGGSPLLLAALAPGLAARGRLEIEVVSIAPLGEIAGVLQERGIRVTSLQARGSRDVGVVPRFVRQVGERRPGVVCSILIHANLLATLAKPFVGAAGGIKWVHSIHTLQERPRWHWYVQGVISSYADAFIAPSRAVVEKLEGYGPVPRAFVIPNGIDVARFRDAAAIEAAQKPWPGDAMVVGYVGRFDVVKRLPLLLQAAALLVKRGAALGRLHVALAGYGAEEGRLRALARELGLENRVHFLGAVCEPERWYKAFDVFCSPSAAEGFGLTLAEAAVAGVPVVACETGAVRETLAGVKGVLWLSEEPTAEEVARRIEEGLMAAAQGEDVKLPEEVAERLSKGTMIEAYEGCFLDILRRG